MKPTPHALDRPNSGQTSTFAPAHPIAASTRFGVVLNPRSHRNKGCSEKMPAEADVAIATPRTKADLAKQLADFAAQNIDVLMIDGGDGTIRDVLTYGAPVFGDAWPKLVILPKGKTNALACDLGLPRNWALDEAWDAARKGRTIERRPILVEPLGSDEGRMMGFILGAGIFKQAIDAGQVAHRFGAFQGFAVGVTGAFAVMQALFGIGASPWRRQSPVRIFAEPGGQDLEHSGHGSRQGRFFAGFSTLSEFPLGMRPFGPNRGAISYLVMDAPLRRAVAMVPMVLMGSNGPRIRKLGIHRGSGEAFVLDTGSEYILDGEIFPPGRYRLRMGPRLRFIVP